MSEDLVRRRLIAAINYDILQEVLFSLEYENVFGGLSSTEEQLLALYREVWTDCHMGKSIFSQSTRDCDPKLRDIFWSRFEEKVDEKLAAIGDDFATVENPETIRESNRHQWAKISQQVARLGELASYVVCTQQDLFARRAVMQRQLALALGKTLSREVKYLTIRTNNLEEEIKTYILQPSQRSTNLRNAYEQLMQEKKHLEARVTELTNLLDAYMAHESQYLELACKKADAQHQANFIQHLQSSVSLGSGRRRSLSENYSNIDEKGKSEQKFLYTNL